MQLVSGGQHAVQHSNLFYQHHAQKLSAGDQYASMSVDQQQAKWHHLGEKTGHSKACRVRTCAPEPTRNPPSL